MYLVTTNDLWPVPFVHVDKPKQGAVEYVVKTLGTRKELEEWLSWRVPADVEKLEVYEVTQKILVAAHYVICNE